MDDSRRGLYTPVRDQIVRKNSRKPLQQGSLQSTSSTNFSSSIIQSGEIDSRKNVTNKSVEAFAKEIDVLSRPSSHPKVIPFLPSNTLSAVLNHSANNSRVHIENPRKINIPCANSRLSENVIEHDSNSFVRGGTVVDSSAALTGKHEIDNAGTFHKPKLEKKKKMVKVIQSRYKNTASTSKVHSANSENSIEKAAPLKRQPSLKRQHPQNTSNSHKSHVALPRPNIPKTTSQPNIYVAKTMFNNVASTPNAAFKTFFEPEVSHIETSARKGETENDNSNEEKYVITDDDLEYSRTKVLQIQYLKLKMQQAATARHKEAIKMMLVLEETNQNLRDEVYKNERKVKLLQNQRLLDEVIDLQKNALGPVINKIDETQENYCQVANNLDASRHVLPVRDVFVPTSLESNLVHSQDFMNDISNLLYGRVKDCQRFSGQCSKLKEEVCDVNAVLSSSVDLSHDIHALSIVQKSLQMQYTTEMI